MAPPSSTESLGSSDHTPRATQPTKKKRDTLSKSEHEGRRRAAPRVSGSSPQMKKLTPKKRIVRRVASCPAGQKNVNVETRRRVKFSPDIDTRPVVQRCDISEDEFQLLWYTKNEFHEMKKLMLPTLNKMTRNEELDHDEDPRGLEHKTPFGSKKRHRNRVLSLDAVLQEQERQFESNRRDQEFIAQLYRQSTAHCMMHASLTGKEDAEYVNNYVREDVPSLNPASSYDSLDDEDSSDDKSVKSSDSPCSVIRSDDMRMLSAAA